MSNPSSSPGSRPLEQLKVAELRDALRKRGLSMKGVKKDLFERLDEAVRKEQAGAPLGVPEVVENQHGGVHEGEHVVAESGGLPHYYNTLEAAQDGDSMSYLNDGENCLQDPALIVNNALPYVGTSDATPVFLEPRKDMENPNTGSVANVGSMDDVASVNNITTDDLAESGNVGVRDAGGVPQTDNSMCTGGAVLLEADNQGVGTAAAFPESDNQASGTEAIVLVPDNQASRNLPEPGKQASGSTASPEAGTQAEAGGIDAVRPTPVVAASDISDVATLGGKNVTMMAEPMDGSLSTYSHPPGGNDALVDEHMALVKEAGGAEVASIGEECEDDKTSAPVSDDTLIVADASISVFDNAVTENSCSVQNVEVFENTILTGVSVVPCVQEPVEDRDGGGLKIEIAEAGKDDLLVEDTEQSELQLCGAAAMPADMAAPEMPRGVAMLEAVQHPILPEVQQDTVTRVSLQSSIEQEAAQDLVMQEAQQDIEMSEALESAFMKAEASDDTKPPAVVMDATNTFADMKSENLGETDAVDSRKHSEARGRLVDREKLDVKLEPMEAESRAGRRPMRVENVKVEQQDVKEEPSKSGRYFDRSRPKESDYERSRRDPSRYGDERNRAEGRTGRVFREEGRKDARERDLKPDEESSHLRNSHKRKDDDRDFKLQEPAKRVRRWNSGNQLVVETAKPLTTGTVKEIMSPEIRKDGFAVVPPKLTPKLTGPSKPTPSAAKADSEANGDKRAVPPSTRTPTASLKIERFVRPFTLKALRDLLSQFGHCIDFWMDQIKTHCYVTYSKVDEAVAARNGLYDKQWPPSFGNLLVADFVESSEVKIRSDGSFEKVNAPQATTPRGITNQPPAPGAQPSGSVHGHSNSLASAAPLRERQLMQVPVKDPEPPIPTLDDLFRKTKAKPHIYYLPLTDEQVAEKLASVKHKEQQLVRGKPLGRV